MPGHLPGWDFLSTVEAPESMKLRLNYPQCSRKLPVGFTVQNAHHPEEVRVNSASAAAA